MARLDINVRGIDRAGDSPSQLQGALERTNSLLERQLRIQEQISRRLQSQGRNLRTLGRDGAQAAQTINAQFNQAVTNINVSVRSTSQTIVNQMESAAKQVESRWSRVGRSISQALSRATRGAGRGGALGIGRGIASSLGGGARTLLTGGITDIAGNVLRSVSRLGSDLLIRGAEVGSKLIQGIANGAAGAVSGLLSLTGPIGSALGKALEGTVGVVSRALGGVLEAAAGLAGGVLQVAGELGGAIADALVKTFSVVAAAGIGVSLVGVFKAIRFEEVSLGFTNLTETLGGSEQALEGFRRASRGTASDLDLVTKFNNAFTLGAVRTTEQFEFLIDASRRLAKNLGRDTTDALNRLVLGLGKSEQRLLDELGVVINAGKVYRDYAAAIGVATDELTDSERSLAFQQAAFTQIEEKLRALGPEVDTVGDSWRQFRATIENLVTSLGSALLPVFRDLIAPIQEVGASLADFLKDNRVQIANALSGALSGIVDGIRNIANVIQNEGLGGALDRLLQASVDLWEGFVNLALDAARQVARALDPIAKSVAEIIDGLSGAGNVIGGLTTFDGDQVLRGLTQRDRVRPSNIVSNLLPSERFEVDRSTLPDISQSLEANGFREAVSEGVKEGIRESAGTSAPGFTPAAAGGLTGITTTPQGPDLSGLSQQLAANLDELFDISELSGEYVDAITDFFDAAIQDAETLESAVERTGRLVDRARENAAREEIRALEESARASERAIEESQRRQEQLQADIVRAAERSAQARERIEEQLARELESINDRLISQLQNIAGQIESRANSIIGNLDPGTGEGVPTRFRTAARRVQQDRTRRRRELFNQFGAGITSDQLSANDGALLEQITRQVAAAEINAPALTAQAVADAVQAGFAATREAESAEAEAIAALQTELVAINEKATADTLAAFEAFRAADEELIALATEEQQALRETLAATAAAQKAEAAVLAKTTADLAALRREFENVRRALQALGG